jgi:hypothetical protein
MGQEVVKTYKKVLTLNIYLHIEYYIQNTIFKFIYKKHT